MKLDKADRKRWTCEEDAKLIKAHEQGMSAGYIARQLHRSHGAIKSRLQKHYFHKDWSDKCLPELTDDAIRKMWTDAGGTFHGPITETATMTEARIIKFIRSLL